MKISNIIGMIMAKKKKEKQEEVIENEEVLEDVEDKTSADVESSAEEEASEPVSEASVEKFKAELAEALKKADENLDGWQRTQADLANYRKRIERERETARETMLKSILQRYLDVSDDLILALKNRPESGEGAEWAGGIELIGRKLESLLENEGLKLIEAEGEQFDPRLHEAVSMEESDDHESGQIIDVLKPGYMLGEKVLRASLVRVAV